MRSRFIMAITVLLLVSACASNGTVDLSEEETIHSCIYNAMDEAAQERKWVKWDSEANNCSLIDPHRGELLLKEAEVIQNRVCAEFFIHFQMYLSEQGWQDYEDYVITACRHPTKSEWFAYKGDSVLDLLIIDEILSK